MSLRSLCSFKPIRPALAGALILAFPVFAHACATCGCSLSTDAAMGYSAAPGWRINIDYSFINQNQMRSGTHAVPATQPAGVNASGGEQEVERQTVNRYINLGISYAPSANWNISAIIPYIDRSHTTYGNATPDQLTGDSISGASSKGLGDIKLIGSYQGFLPTHNLGIQFGVKLPTGHYGGQNTDTGQTVGRKPAAFSSGPASPDSILDTSLQTGTGSTDIIIGAYYYQPVSQNFDAFINGQFQAAMTHRLDQTGADFRPGNTTSLSAGLRYEAHPAWVPQLQLNYTSKSRDRGALADTANTAGKTLYLSPGITVTVFNNVQIYGFVQKAIYSKLDGYQIAPRWTATMGASYAF